MKLCGVVSVLLLLLLGICSSRCQNAAETETVEDRIVGGRVVNISNHPYVVAIRQNGRYICAGALVTPRHVVTAAHCLNGATRSSITVQGGVSNLQRRGMIRGVAGMWIPRAFKESTKNMDVGVIKLRQPMNGTNISTVSVCDHQLRPGNLLNFAAWGATSASSSTSSRRLRATSLQVRNINRCVRPYRGIARITRNMLCAGGSGTRDTCSGDSGGPGIHQGQLCAITSFGVGCANRGIPGIYTKINPRVRRFINNQLSK